MKTLRKLIAMTLFAVVLITSVGLIQSPAWASENLINNIASNNWGMYATPALGEMTIDATFDDWDWSPRIKMFPDYDAQSVMSSEVCANYDANNLYLGFIKKDITPLNNTVDPNLEWTITWRGDCYQLRFRGDHNIWFTFAYHKLTDQYSVLVDELTSDARTTLYNTMYFSDPGSTKLTNTYDKGKNPRPGGPVIGMEFCAKVDVQVSPDTVNWELKIPKAVLFYEATEPFKAGDIIQMGIECYWSNDTGRAIATNYKDNLQAGESTRDFFWTAYKVWGNIEFLDKNNIEVRQYKKDVISPLSGFFEIDIEVDKKAKFLTVVIDNEDGQRVRNLIAELEVDGTEYVIEEKLRTKTVRVLWDGRNNVGGKVSPGTYYFKGITHEGITPVYDYHFYAPGKVPWNSTVPEAGWLADHNPPESVFAYDDMVYIGAHFAEGGQGLIAYDPKIQEKVWGITYGAKVMTANEKYIYGQPGWTFTFSSAISGNKFVNRVNRADGTYAPFSVFGESQKVEYGNDLLLGVLNGQTVPWITGLAANDDILVVATSESPEVKTSGSGGGLYQAGGPTYKNYISGLNLLRHDDVHVYKRIAIEAVGEVCFSKDYQHLYAVSGNSLVEVNWSSGEVTPVKLDLKGDYKIGSITTDYEGNVLIFDRGEDCQIKAFNPETGRLMYTIGKKGGRAYDGKTWEAEGLIPQVTSITVGYEGRVYAVECFDYPRRVTEWNRNGELMYEMVGNTEYQCMGVGLHETDPTLAYYGGAEMKIDIANNTYKMNRVQYVPNLLEYELFPILPSYMVENFTSEASGEKHNYAWSAGTLYIEHEDGRYRPCFRSGNISDFIDVANDTALKRGQWFDKSQAAEINRYWASEFSGLQANDSYVWNDLNMDGIVQREECDIYPLYADDQQTYSRAIFSDQNGKVPYKDRLNANPAAGTVQITSKHLVDYIDQFRGKSLYFDDGTPAFYYDENGEWQPVTATVTVTTNFYNKTNTTVARNDYKWLQHSPVPNGTYWDQRVTMDTMQWAGYTADGLQIGIWTPERFNENGAPIYTMGGSVHYLEVGAKMGQSCILTEGTNHLLVCPTNSMSDYYANAIKCYDRYTGKLIWDYRNDHPGVHGSHSAGMQQPYGVISGPLKMLGTLNNKYGDKFTIIRGNHGTDYMITEEGYLFKTLFQDSRMVALSLPANMQQGYDMSDATEGPEPFGGNAATHTDGNSRIIVTTGGRAAVVARLEGLNSIKHFKDIKFTVTLKQLEECWAYVKPVEEGTGVVIEDVDSYEIKYAAKGFNIDGASDDWSGYGNLNIKADGAAEYSDTKLAWNEQNLYAIFEVRDDSPMVNQSPEHTRLFKFGDVCDINLSASANTAREVKEGDIRILLSVYKGEPVAVLMKQIDGLKTGTESMQYSSPVTTTDYDTVRIMTDVKMVINRTDTGYTVEAEIPWKSLNFNAPSTETKMTGDVGLVTSDETGSKNLARIYYFNKDTGLTSDMPGEAKCYPAQWGGITFSSDDPSVMYWEMFGDK